MKKKNKQNIIHVVVHVNLMKIQLITKMEDVKV